jgi:phasin
MHEQFARQVLAAAAKTEVPAEVRAFAQESVGKAREAYARWAIGAEKGSKAIEDAIRLAQLGVMTVGEKALGNALANTEAAFDAAGELARAKTLQEAAQLQAKFLQMQMNSVGEQGKALFELSLNFAKEAADALTAIASSTAGDLKAAVA